MLSWLKLTAIGALLGLGALVVSSCSSSSSDIHEDCASGPACQVDAECSGETVCSLDQCTKIRCVTDGGGCTTSAVCDTGLLCARKEAFGVLTCNKPVTCTTSANCSTEFICAKASGSTCGAAGICMEPLARGAVCCDSMECATGTSCTYDSSSSLDICQ